MCRYFKLVYTKQISLFPLNVYFLVVLIILISKILTNIYWDFSSFTALERKISVRANREELVQKGILLPESPLGNIQEPGES